MAIVTERVYRVTSWDVQQHAVVDRVFSEGDMDNLKRLIGNIHHGTTDEFDTLSFIKHRYYGAPYYEYNEQRHVYQEPGIDNTIDQDNAVQLTDDALRDISSKLSPGTYGKMASLNLFNQKPAYRYADVFPMTAAMRAIDESIKTGNAGPWLPTIRKAMSPRVSSSMLIANIWLSEVNPVTSLVMAQNAGRWSESWLSREQQDLLSYDHDSYLATIIDNDTPPQSPERVSFDPMMLSQRKYKMALAEKFLQPLPYAPLQANQLACVRELLTTEYTGDAFAYIQRLLAIINAYQCGGWLIYPDVASGMLHEMLLDNGDVLLTDDSTNHLWRRYAGSGPQPWVGLSGSRILTQQTLSDPAIARLVRNQPSHPVVRALYANRESLDLGALGDTLLLEWAQQIRNGIYN